MKMPVRVAEFAVDFAPWAHFSSKKKGNSAHNLGFIRKEGGLLTQSFHVKGMSCHHCQVRVEKALLSLPGAVLAVASVANGTVTLTYDEKTLGANRIHEAIFDAGYEVC